MEPVLEERIGILDPVDVADEGILIGVQPLIKEGCLNNTVIEDVREGYDDQVEAEQYGYECRKDTSHSPFFGNGSVDGME